MALVNTGSATWEGDLKSGKGTVSTKSGALSSQPYGFNTRFEGKPGTNPEELVGAAHAACFAMAMSLLSKLSMVPVFSSRNWRLMVAIPWRPNSLRANPWLTSSSIRRLTP